MAITGAVAAAVRKFDPFPEFSEVRAFRGRRETGGRQFYKSGGLIVPRYELLPGVLVQGGAGFGQREVNGAWRGARDGEPLIGDGGLRGAEGRPNSIRNPVMAGAAVGSRGALPTGWFDEGSAVSISREILAVGITDTGLPYIDIRYFGVTTGTFSNIIFDVNANAAPASVGQVWTSEVYIALIGGSFTNISARTNTIYERTEGGGYLRAVAQAINYTETLTQSRQSGPLAAANVARVNSGLSFGHAVGVPVDFTLRIAAPNLKLGPDINDPPILQTTGLPATRTAMVYRESGRNIAPVHYGVARARWLAPLANHGNTFVHALEFRAAGGSRVLWLRGSGEAQRFTVSGAAGGSPYLDINTPVVGVWNTVAWAVRAGQLAISVDGAAIQSGALASLPDPLTFVGALNSSGPTGGLNSANAELDIWAAANGEISNDAIQALSARFAA